jgi:membrane-associated phospholipid phosphatase
LREKQSIYLHEWISVVIVTCSCLLLLLLLPGLKYPDTMQLVHRAVSNIWNLAKLQLLVCLGLSVLVILLGRIPQLRAYFAFTGPQRTIVTMLRASIPLLMLIVLQQTIPLWQRVVGLPEADPSLSRIDEWLFGGTNPTLWLEHLMRHPLTVYMWAAYLSWFVAFQATIYVMVLFRSESEWQEMILAIVLTLAISYICYVLVPAVGPIHAMQSRFTVDPQGGSIAQVTNNIVDRFGVGRDAFPSIHAAISLLMVVYAWRYLRRLAVPYTIMGASIILSTVYLRWHYVTDVLAGVILTLICTWLSPRLLHWWGQRVQSTTTSGSLVPTTGD